VSLQLQKSATLLLLCGIALERPPMAIRWYKVSWKSAICYRSWIEVQKGTKKQAALCSH
jgi:hypothetical protein